jgi:signal transduction histidine kinase
MRDPRQSGNEQDRWADGRQDESWKTSVKKAFLFSATAGALFGLAFSLLMLVTGFPYLPQAPILVAVPIFTGLMSGLAGAGGAFLDRSLIRRGMRNAGLRRLVTFLAVAAAPLILTGAAAFRFHFMVVEAQMWSVAIGLIFGAAVAAVDYRLGQMRQKMLTLEIENKYLSEIAHKDSLLAEATENLVLAEERNRVAQDLHDSVSSGIHGMAYAVHSLRQAVSGPEGEVDPKVAGIIDLLDKTAQSAQDELRAMILELKPSLLDEKGLAEALRLHCELFSQRQNIPVDLSLEDAPGLSAEQQVAVYRVAQEALANVQKHSGATGAAVSITHAGDQTVLTVSDNGKGFEPHDESSGFGLRNMESRCVRNSGSFKVISSPGAGTRVQASFKSLE